ncbi:MAG: transposase family protein [Kiritimatiellae bacterium]|nr:transposase family protein [Kiritimatiellia bacterium]
MAARKAPPRAGVSPFERPPRGAAAGLVKPPRKPRPPAHVRRWQREAIGELWQLDEHAEHWFGPRLPAVPVFDMLDDCSRVQVGCAMFEHENLRAYIYFLRICFERYGLPLQIYVDQASFFRSDKEGSHTQLEERLLFYGISLVLANSPESKGKVERVHQVWQDRLEPRLHLLRPRKEGLHGGFARGRRDVLQRRGVGVGARVLLRGRRLGRLHVLARRRRRPGADGVLRRNRRDPPVRGRHVERRRRVPRLGARPVARAGRDRLARDRQPRLRLARPRAGALAPRGLRCRAAPRRGRPRARRIDRAGRWRDRLRPDWRRGGLRTRGRGRRRRRRAPRGRQRRRRVDEGAHRRRQLRRLPGGLQPPHGLLLGEPRRRPARERAPLRQPRRPRKRSHRLPRHPAGREHRRASRRPRGRQPDAQLGGQPRPAGRRHARLRRRMDRRLDALLLLRPADAGPDVFPCRWQACQPFGPQAGRHDGFDHLRLAHAARRGRPLRVRKLRGHREERLPELQGLDGRDPRPQRRRHRRLGLRGIRNGQGPGVPRLPHAYAALDDLPLVAPARRSGHPAAMRGKRFPAFRSRCLSPRFPPSITLCVIFLDFPPSSCDNFSPFRPFPSNLSAVRAPFRSSPFSPSTTSAILVPMSAYVPPALGIGLAFANAYETVFLLLVAAAVMPFIAVGAAAVSAE